MQVQERESINQRITEAVYVLRPGLDTLRELPLLISDDRDTPLRVIAPEETLRGIDREYTKSCHLIEPVEQGVLMFRASDTTQQSLIVSPDATSAVVSLNGSAEPLTAQDSEFADHAVSYAEEQWEAADEFKFRTPSEAAVKDAFADYIATDEFYSTFHTIVSAMEQEAVTQRPPGERLLSATHVYVSVVLAIAAESELVINVGQACESCGLTSRPSLNRLKNGLEDTGYIVAKTEDGMGKGRPPERLHIQGLYRDTPLDKFAKRIYNEYVQ